MMLAVLSTTSVSALITDACGIVIATNELITNALTATAINFFINLPVILLTYTFFI
jgi:hypothetical protein